MANPRTNKDGKDQADKIETRAERDRRAEDSILRGIVGLSSNRSEAEVRAVKLELDRRRAKAFFDSYYGKATFKVGNSSSEQIDQAAEALNDLATVAAMRDEGKEARRKSLQDLFKGDKEVEAILSIFDEAKRKDLLFGTWTGDDAKAGTVATASNFRRLERIPDEDIDAIYGERGYATREQFAREEAQRKEEARLQERIIDEVDGSPSRFLALAIYYATEKNLDRFVKWYAIATGDQRQDMGSINFRVAAYQNARADSSFYLAAFAQQLIVMLPLLIDFLVKIDAVLTMMETPFLRQLIGTGTVSDLTTVADEIRRFLNKEARRRLALTNRVSARTIARNIVDVFERAGFGGVEGDLLQAAIQPEPEPEPEPETKDAPRKLRRRQ